MICADKPEVGYFPLSAIGAGSKTVEYKPVRDWHTATVNAQGVIEAVYTRGSLAVQRRKMWYMGQLLTIQPRANRHGELVVRVMGISQLCLQSLTLADVVRAGCPAEVDPVEWFRKMWDARYRRKGARWENNPKVWMLEFELYKP